MDSERQKIILANKLCNIGIVFKCIQFSFLRYKKDSFSAKKQADKHLKKERKLEDLKVLKCSHDIKSQDLNNVKLGQGQPRLIIYTYFGSSYIGKAAIWVK